MMNVSPVMTEALGIDANTMNIAVSLAALFSGIFIVVIGGLARQYRTGKNFQNRIVSGNCRLALGGAIAQRRPCGADAVSGGGPARIFCCFRDAHEPGG